MPSAQDLYYQTLSQINQKTGSNFRTGDVANPNDMSQQAKWAGEKASAASTALTNRGNYLLSNQRRSDNVGFFSGLANRTAGGTEDYMAQLSSQGLLGASSLVSRFAKSQERDRRGKAFIAAGNQTASDEQQAGGLLQSAGSLSLQQQDSYQRQANWEEQMRNSKTDFWDVLGSIGGTALGAATGGMSMALGSWGKDVMGGLLGLGGENKSNYGRGY